MNGYPSVGEIISFEGYNENGCKVVETIKDTVCRAIGQYPVGTDAVPNQTLLLGSDCLLHKIPSQTPVIAQNTNSISLVAGGTYGHTISANLNVSSVSDNLLTILADGAYVAPFAETPNSSTNTQTANTTVSGTLNRNVSVDVNVSATAGNIITVMGDGLYVPASLASETANSATDTNTVDLTLSGAFNRNIQADVKISSTLNNILTTFADGLYVPASLASETPNTVVDTASVNLTASGAFNRTIQADVKVSTTAGNAIVTNADGLYVPTSGVTETPNTVTDTSTIDFTASGVFNRDITGSVKVSATAGNAIVTNADGLYVPTSGVTETANTVTDSTTIDLTASGSFNRNITASAKISSVAGNILTTQADGLYVPASGAAETPNTVVDTNSINLTASGVFNRTIQADVIVSPTANNIITTLGNGLYASQATVAVLSQNGISLSASGTAGHNLSVAANIQHDSTLSGIGTTGSPLIVDACNVINSLPFTGNKFGIGDQVVTSDGITCELKQMTPCTAFNPLDNSAWTIGQFIAPVGPPYTITDSFQQLFLYTGSNSYDFNLFCESILLINYSLSIFDNGANSASGKVFEFAIVDNLAFGPVPPLLHSTTPTFPTGTNIMYFSGHARINQALMTPGAHSLTLWVRMATPGDSTDAGFYANVTFDLRLA